MTLLIAVMVGLIFAASIYMMTGGELKGICMGVFLLGHGANLAILSVSGTPLGRQAPVIGHEGRLTGMEVDPLPQALILTAIVIGAAIQAFLLVLLVLTWRRSGSLDTDVLEGRQPAGGYPAQPVD